MEAIMVAACEGYVRFFSHDDTSAEKEQSI